jgi:hypothetical protein
MTTNPIKWMLSLDDLIVIVQLVLCEIVHARRIYDLLSTYGPGCRTYARQCWTPIQTQLHILERLYHHANCTPKKPKIDVEFNEGDAGYSEQNVDPCENRHNIFLMGSRQARHEGNHENNNMVLRHVDTDAHVLKKNCSLVNIKTCANDQQQFYGT